MGLDGRLQIGEVIGVVGNGFIAESTEQPELTVETDHVPGCFAAHS